MITTLTRRTCCLVAALALLTFQARAGERYDPMKPLRDEQRAIFDADLANCLDTQIVRFLRNGNRDRGQITGNAALVCTTMYAGVYKMMGVPSMEFSEHVLSTAEWILDNRYRIND